MANKEDGQEDYIQKQIMQNQEKSKDLQEQLNSIELTMRESIINQPQSPVNADAGGANVLDNKLEPEKEKGSDQDIRKPCNGQAWCSGDSDSAHCSYTAAIGRVVNMTQGLPSPSSAPPTTPPPVTLPTAAPQRAPVSETRTLTGTVVGVVKQSPIATPPRNTQLMSPADFSTNPNQTRGGRRQHVNRANFAARPAPARRAGVGRGNIPGNRNSRRGRNHQPSRNYQTTVRPCKLGPGFRWFCILNFQLQVIEQAYELLQEQMSAGLALAITALILLVVVLCK